MAASGMKVLPTWVPSAEQVTWRMRTGRRCEQTESCCENTESAAIAAESLLMIAA